MGGPGGNVVAVTALTVTGRAVSLEATSVPPVSTTAQPLGSAAIARPAPIARPSPGAGSLEAFTHPLHRTLILPVPIPTARAPLVCEASWLGTRERGRNAQRSEGGSRLLRNVTRDLLDLLDQCGGNRMDLNQGTSPSVSTDWIRSSRDPADDPPCSRARRTRLDPPGGSALIGGPTEGLARRPGRDAHDEHHPDRAHGCTRPR